MRLRHIVAGWSVRREHALVCRQAVELMTDYVEGGLSPQARSWYELHLARCRACSIYLDQLRATVAALGQLEPAPVPAQALDELVELYRRSRRD